MLWLADPMDAVAWEVSRPLILLPFPLCACTYSASTKLMPAVLSETVAVTASVAVVFYFYFLAKPRNSGRSAKRVARQAASL